MQNIGKIILIAIISLPMAACIPPQKTAKKPRAEKSNIEPPSNAVEIWAVDESCKDCRAVEFKTESGIKLIPLAHTGLIADATCIDAVSTGFDPMTAQPQLQIAFKAECHANVLRKSTEHLNKEQVILLQGSVISSAQSRTAFSSGLVLSGLSSYAEVDAIYKRIPDSLKQ
jgi:preprotein translocase subunit SecD